MYPDISIVKYVKNQIPYLNVVRVCVWRAFGAASLPSGMKAGLLMSQVLSRELYTVLIRPLAWVLGRGFHPPKWSSASVGSGEALEWAVRQMKLLKVALDTHETPDSSYHQLPKAHLGRKQALKFSFFSLTWFLSHSKFGFGKAW